MPPTTGDELALDCQHRGVVVVALDYLGISDTSRPLGIPKAGRHVLGAVQDRAAHQVSSARRRANCTRPCLRS